LKHYADAAIDAALAGADLAGTLRRAFVDFANGAAAMQPRVRTDCGPMKLSTLGAVWPGEGFAGAKIYTTIAGRFSFVFVLFSSDTGAALATFDGDALTRWRTAAVTVLAAERFARPQASTLALFGTGVHARAHLEAYARAFPLRSVRIVSRGTAVGFSAHARTLVPDVGVVSAREALRGADLVVTATRAARPLFDGALVESGAMVAAVGSSKPDAREIDDALLARASVAIVDWREQTLREAGDLVQADPAVLASLPIVDLGVALRDATVAQRPGGDVVVFKAVGVGLADVAAASLAYRRLSARTA
jgi:ornithine cyclodeaminase